MQGIVSRRTRRFGRIGRLVAALGVSAATVPVVLGAFAQPSGAATPAASGASSNIVETIVADVQCDVGWVVWDLDETFYPPAGPSPFCTPVPPGLAGATL